MSPQFADFNADGRLDIVVGTFDGSPHVAFGSEQGYETPTHVLDAKGERILINQFWNFVSEEWDDTKRCDPEGSDAPNGHCTSAVAFDWDADGDLDLLLGDYDTGRLYLRLNEGSAGAPKFATVNTQVQAGGKPLIVKGKMSTPRLVDWDKDGKIDLVCGSFGEGSYDDASGGVYLFRNVGKVGAPEFAAAETLIAPGEGGAAEPKRPDYGLYPDVADVDGDGDLDIIVGGSARWTPPSRELSAAERERVKTLKSELAKLSVERNAAYKKLAFDDSGMDKSAKNKKREELYEAVRPELDALEAKTTPLQSELDDLLPSRKSVYSVWLYLNEG